MKKLSLNLNKKFENVFDGNTDPSVRYEDLALYRREYVDLAIFCSAYTIPETIPWTAASEYNDTTTYETNMISKPCSQSVGAEGVSALATRFYQNLFPTNSPFFKLEIDDILLQRKADEFARPQIIDAHQSNPENAGQELDPDFDPQELSPDLKKQYKSLYNKVTNQAKASTEKVVKLAMEEYNRLNIDHKMKELFVNLIIAGNALLEVTEDTCRIYSIDQYVVNRDPRGELTEIIIKEMVDITTLPKEFVEEHDEVMAEKAFSTDAPVKNDVPVYTWTKFIPEENVAYTFQSVWGKLLPGSESIYPKDACRFIPCRFDSHHNRDWGIPFVKQCIRDLYVLDRLTEATTKGIILATRILYTISPGSTTTLEQFTRVPNGGVIHAEPNDVNVIQLNKNNDFASVSAYMDKIERSLQAQFGVQRSIARDAERVTAEEIKANLHALDMLSAAFLALFKFEVQYKLSVRLLHLLNKKGTLPKDYVPGTKEASVLDVHPITGLSALADHQDIDTYAEFMQNLINTIGPEQVAKHINLTEYVNRLAIMYGVHQDNLVRSEEELLEEEQQLVEQAEKQRQEELEAQQQSDVVKSGSATAMTQRAADMGILDPSLEAQQQTVSEGG